MGKQACIESIDEIKRFLEDGTKMAFITAGLVAFLMLVPLAATSSNAMVRRLGGRRWQSLHRLIYPAALIAVLHFTWMVKLDITEPALYGVLLAVLLGVRLYWRVFAAPGAAMQTGFPRGGQRIIPIQPRR